MIFINKMLLFFKKTWWQILVIFLIASSCISLICYFYFSQPNQPIASIYFKDQIIRTIDLNASKDEIFYVDGEHDRLQITIKDHQIGITHSDCPLQYCVNMGLTNKANMPIVCMYNGIYIIISGESDFDIAI